MPPDFPTLVTGAGGFVGSRVAAAWPNSVPWPGVDLRVRARVETAVKHMLDRHAFATVLHLAAAASVQDSFSDPVRAFEVNTMGTLHLLEALAKAGWTGRFLFVSTGAVYGDPDKLRQPLQEDSPRAPTSPYAASKAAGEHAVLEWGQRSGATALVARPLNHAGPGQSEHYFLADMARQITRVPRGGWVRVEVGNLESHRDFLHVDDVVDAYGALLRKGKAGCVYNVARGHSQPMARLLERLIELSGRKVEVVSKAERFRAEPSRPLEVSIARIVADTGWSACRGLDQLFNDLIEFWETN